MENINKLINYMEVNNFTKIDLKDVFVDEQIKLYLSGSGNNIYLVCLIANRIIDSEKYASIFNHYSQALLENNTKIQKISLLMILESDEHFDNDKFKEQIEKNIDFRIWNILNNKLEISDNKDFFNLKKPFSKIIETKEAVLQDDFFKIKKSNNIYICILILIINVLVHIYIHFILKDSASEQFILNYGNNFYAVFKEKQFYRLVTHIFMHASNMHLVQNMAFLYILGSIVETHFGKANFLFIYFVSGIAAGLMSALLNMDKFIISLGASAAVLGLTSALLLLPEYNFMARGSLDKATLIVLIILNIGTGFIYPNVDNVGHISGIIFGFIATFIIILIRKLKYKKLLDIY